MLKEEMTSNKFPRAYSAFEDWYLCQLLQGDLRGARRKGEYRKEKKNIYFVFAPQIFKSD
jgi:hypothetical protein